VTTPATLDGALAVHRAGRLGEADTLYGRILADEPRNAEALRLRGVLACQEGRFAAAVDFLERAIGIAGQNAVYHANLGVALKGLGRAADALAALQKAAVLDPGSIDIRYNIGCLLQELDRRDEAAAAYQAVLAADPDHAEALSNLGLLHIGGGQPDQALPLLRRAVSLAPQLLAARINLGIALHDLEQFDAAAGWFMQALEVNPESAELRYNLANALHALHRYEEAIVQGQRAIELRPDYAEAYHNLGNAWRELGDPKQAVASYRQALALDRKNVLAWRNLLSTLLYSPDVPPAARFVEHRHFASACTAPAPRAVRPVNPDPNRSLRIGYVSSDFRRHPVARNLEPILAEHRRQGFFVALYAQVRTPDEVTGRFRAAADLWRSIVSLSDEAVAEQIESDRIDILVHLAGRFDRNRPTLAGFRAAPIQISFHDPATSGFSEMDYLIADRVLVPRSTVERFAERPLRLPSFYTHAPLVDAPDPGPLPAGEDRPITFVSFNHPAKISEAVLDVWGQILRRVPTARLSLKHRHRFSRPALQARILDGLRAAGVDRERLVFGADDVERRDHLALYRQADIALDPFPFTGSTTTFEALWMGVPVVTLAGRDMVARWSESMLRTLKLDELVAASPEDYIDIAANLAADRPRLSRLRGSLRPLLASSPLCNGERRARQIGRLYRAVWRRWCAAQANPSSKAAQ